MLKKSPPCNPPYMILNYPISTLTLSFGSIHRTCLVDVWEHPRHPFRYQFTQRDREPILAPQIS